jgi:DNA-binding protein HU-beta
MNKFELINQIAYITKFTKKEINLILSLLIELIINSVAKNEKVTLVGFGCFKLREVKGRQGFNPQTRQHIYIPASKKPLFLAGKFFKHKVNNLN